MYHVKTMNKISKIGLAQLDDRFEISDTMEHEDAILVRSAKLHDYDFPAELLCIARAGAGVNNIPLDKFAEAGIVVFNPPGPNANGVKELTIAALLLASRKISQGITWVKEQSAAGADISAVVEKGKSAYVGPEIMGKTLGVVGLGAIGVLVANAAAALGMNIVGYDPFLSVKHALNLTPGDALLVYLSVYRYSDACQSTPAQVRENLSRLWDEIKILTEPHAVQLSLEPKPGSEPLLSKLNIFAQKPSQLKVVFLHEYDAKTSAWVRGHEKGIEALKAEFGDRLLITNRENVSPEVDAEQILEEVAHDNADVVFTTSIRMRTACLKVAAQHPKTKFLNCCLNTPHPLVRTYYPRTYEVNYLLGMLAGILSKTDRVGYVAANPVYGVPAAVNAFARGLRAVRPDAHVVLRWACAPVEGQPLNFSDRQDIPLLYARSSSEPAGSDRDYGLCRRLPDGSLQPVALPVWKWEVFYIGIIRSIFNGTWGSEASGKAVNYWWGLQSDAERGDYYEERAGGTAQLLNLIAEALQKHELAIFPAGGLYAQGHVKKVPQGDNYTPKELMQMDWLGECVEGALPQYEDLDVKTRGLIAINGLGSLKGMPL